MDKYNPYRAPKCRLDLPEQRHGFRASKFNFSVAIIILLLAVYLKWDAPGFVILPPKGTEKWGVLMVLLCAILFALHRYTLLNQNISTPRVVLVVLSHLVVIGGVFFFGYGFALSSCKCLLLPWLFAVYFGVISLDFWIYEKKIMSGCSSVQSQSDTV
ncbi:hypothetical protein [Chitinilyticum aquatile]|uniref:hypothetical protein n=1 Tax=Chitinilyticum aquatile TaxID=362520 RepID=UPI0012DDC4C8|nr:hypothetical protein [Chitinilyticum aquatile]